MDLIKQFILANAASFWWSVVAFFVFVVVIYRFGVTAIVAAVDAREERIRKQIEEAEAANAAARQMQAELERKIRATEDQVSTMMSKMRLEAEQARDGLLEKGRGEVEAMRLRALQDIEAARHGAIVQLRQEVADIATEVAGKIIGEKLGDARQGELVAQAIDAYEAAARR